VPTDKSWADTDYKLAYENTKSVLQMRQILNFFFVGNDATIEAYAAKYLASLPTTDKKRKL
jgi:zinc protease